MKKNAYPDTPILERREDTRGWDHFSLTVFILGTVALLFVGYMGYQSVIKGIHYGSIKQLSEKIINTYLKEYENVGIKKRRYTSSEDQKSDTALEAR